jgi:hypothetical protein
MLDDIRPQIIPDRFGVPTHPAQQVLHPVRVAIACRLRQLPAVLALHRRQQTAQVGQRAPARLHAPEPRRQPLR